MSCIKSKAYRNDGAWKMGTETKETKDGSSIKNDNPKITTIPDYP